MLSDNQLIIGTVLLAVLITVAFYIRRAISYKKRMNLMGVGLPESEITLHPEPKEKTPDSEVGYLRQFISPVRLPIRKGKDIHIREEYHQNIRLITQVIGHNDVSLSGYLDNVLKNHFETYEADIVNLYKKRNDGILNTGK